MLAGSLTGWVFLDAFVHRTAPRGWASVILAVLFMGSMQMIGLGIVGEYVRLIFLEAKGRPTYIVGEYRRHHARRARPDPPARLPLLDEVTGIG